MFRFVSRPLPVQAHRAGAGGVPGGGKVLSKSLVEGPGSAPPVLLHTSRVPAAQKVLAVGVPAGDSLADGDHLSTVLDSHLCHHRPTV